MESKITYMRHGTLRSINIESRLAPNPLAVQFVVIEHELGHDNDVLPQEDHILLEEPLTTMGIEILDVVPTVASGAPKPYKHRM